MLKTIMLTISLVGVSSLTMAQTEAVSSQITSRICAIQGTPSSDQYQTIKRVIAAKGTYGSVEQVYPRFVERVHQAGGNAVINYRASQRFGFWPWRIVRPVIYGTAVKWNTPMDCKQLGGIEI